MSRVKLSPPVFLLLLALPGGNAIAWEGEPQSGETASPEEAQEGARDDPGELAPEEIGRRWQALERWTFEPLALEGPGLRFHLDRHDASFFLQDRRTGVKFFSSWAHRGFASLVTRDGEARALDHVVRVEPEERRIRFAAAPRERPGLAVRFAVSLDADLGGIAIRYEIAPEERDQVAALRLLDDALWLADTDEGGVLLPRGIGEWHPAPAGGALDVRLEGFPATASHSGAGDPPDACCVPLVSLIRKDAGLMVFWDDPRFALAARRRLAGGSRFPGRQGLFLTLEAPGEKGEVYLVPAPDMRHGLASLLHTYRALDTRRRSIPSLRYKTGFHPEHRTLLGSVFLRLSMLEPSAAPRGPNAVRHTFDDAAAIAGRWKSALELEQVTVLLGGWTRPPEPGAPAELAAAPECGGGDALARCAREVKAAGYLFGLALDRDDLVPLIARAPPAAPEAGPAARSRAALESLREGEVFEALARFCAPQLVVLRSGAAPSARDPESFLAARAELAAHGRRVFGLWGADLPGAGDLEAAAYLEGFLGLKTRRPADPTLFPLFPIACGPSARIAVRPGEGLRPHGASGLLAHLIYGEAPAYELPPHRYFEGPPSPPGDGPEWCFARAGGWSEDRGLTPLDIFVKNSYEICSPVASIRAREPFFAHRFLSPGGKVQESRFGHDMRVVINLGREPYEDDESGTILPEYGFVVSHPFFHAFRAWRAGGIDYDPPALFTVRSLEGKMYLRAEKTRIYHGFGPDRIRLGGKEFTVEKEAVVRIW